MKKSVNIKPRKKLYNIGEGDVSLSYGNQKEESQIKLKKKKRKINTFISGLF